MKPATINCLSRRNAYLAPPADARKKPPAGGPLRALRHLY
jgi:hypothetical protein